MKRSFWIGVRIIRDRILSATSSGNRLEHGQDVDGPESFVAVLVSPHAHVDVVLHKKFFQTIPKYLLFFQVLLLQIKMANIKNMCKSKYLFEENLIPVDRDLNLVKANLWRVQKLDRELIMPLIFQPLIFRPLGDNAPGRSRWWEKVG